MKTQNAAPRERLILIVDDDESQRRLLRRWLERSGLQARAFPDGSSCMRAVERLRPDVVLLDVNLGSERGLDVLAQLRSAHPYLPVIMLTVETDVQTVVSSMRAGAWGYLAKPTSRRKLLDAITSACAAGPGRREEEEDTSDEGTFSGIIGDTLPMRDLLHQLALVAPSDVTVLIHGESGTGKELVARALHEQGGAPERPFVAINCAAIPESLQESELFGHEKGAFTGADSQRVGRFEQAHGGTLFLDEVGELAPATQARLLRVLQERRFYRVGGSREIQVDVRIVAATHRDLHADVLDKRFRADLYYRLAVYEMEVSPLRDRRGDVPQLAEFFLQQAAPRNSKPGLRFSPEALKRLVSYDWPGNVRELRNAVERSVVTARGLVRPEDLPRRVRESASLSPAPAPTPQSMEDIERQAIIDALNEANGNVSQVIRVLAIPRTTLYRKLRRYGLR